MPEQPPGQTPATAAFKPVSSNDRIAGQLLTPHNCVFILIDHQPKISSTVQPPDEYLVGNVVRLAKAAKIFRVPVILTSVAAKTFSGPIIQDIVDAVPNHAVIERTSMNCWEDDRFVSAVETIGRRKLVMAGLWTEISLCMPALCALEEGYEVYAVEDASAGTSAAAHEMAMRRMIQAGVVPVTSMQVLLELQRDWARTATLDAVTKTARFNDAT